MSIFDLIEKALQDFADHFKSIITTIEQFVSNAVKRAARFAWNLLLQFLRIAKSVLVLVSVYVAVLVIGSGFFELTYFDSLFAKVVGWLGAAVAVSLFIATLALIPSRRRPVAGERKQAFIWFHVVNICAVVVIILGSSWHYRFHFPLVYVQDFIESIWPNGSTTSNLDPFHLAGTRWRGHVGYSPAFLYIWNPNASRQLNARLKYEGVAEDLRVSESQDGRLVFQGTGYQRESGTGSFGLDSFHGQPSSDGQQLRVSWDTPQRKGECSFEKLDAGADLALATTQLLMPVPGSIAQWRGVVGNWPAALDILPKKPTGEWRAYLTYYGIMEELTVSVRDDGSALFVGTNYQPIGRLRKFFPDILYGELSGDGRTLQGLRTDAQSRGQWHVSKSGVADLPLEGELGASTRVTPSFDCTDAKTAIELEICIDSTLASLDVAMVNSYHSVLDRLAPEEQSKFRQQHSEWFKDYQQACNAVAQSGTSALKQCISQHLTDHAQQLQARLSAGA